MSSYKSRRGRFISAGKQFFSSSCTDAKTEEGSEDKTEVPSKSEKDGQEAQKDVVMDDGENSADRGAATSDKDQDEEGTAEIGTSRYRYVPSHQQLKPWLGILWRGQAIGYDDGPECLWVSRNGILRLSSGICGV